MGYPKCNTTLADEIIHEAPVWNGKTFHELGIYLSAIFGIIAIVVSLYLIFMHATHYLRPWEQRHIIRILFMVPVYAAVSFLSYLYYRHSIYFEVLRDCYEAFAIASFFTLLCHYVAEDLHQQKNYFRSIRPRAWIWPMKYLQCCCGGENGMWRTPRSGLTWFNVIWSGVFQYCFIRVFFTVIAVVTQVFGYYCESSLNPAFAHIWTMGFEAVAVSIAMYCLIQFYIQLRHDIADHNPLLKIAAIKLVIFLSFWQSILISFLVSSNAIKAGPKFGYPDINIGIPAMLLDIEMALFSIFHLWAFSWQPYRLNSKQNLAESVPGHSVEASDYKGGFLGYKAIMEAFNPWDFVKATGRAARWLFVGRRHRTLDSSYNTTRQSMAPDIGLSAAQPSNLEGMAYKAASKQGRFPGDEGEELLTHAQTNPASGPPPAYSREDRYDPSPETGEIGVARSVYGDDESDGRSFRSYDERSRGPSPQPPPPLPVSGNGGVAMPEPQHYQRSGVSPNPSPNRQNGRYGDEYHARQQQVPYDSYQSYRPSAGRPQDAPGSAVPYPNHSSNSRRENRISMPYAPGQGSTERGGGGMF